MNSYRQNMLQKARDILSGKITGNRKAAEIAIATCVHVENSDLILGETTTDEQLNAIITREIKAQLAE